jgi:hypothetical protein
VKKLLLVVLSIPLLSIGLMSVALAQTLTQVEPQINHWGGAVGSVAVNPLSPNELLIGTTAGGMYRSVTTGRTWIHLDDFPALTVSFVSFRPGNSEIIIATSGFDTKTARGGAIWRSLNGGLTWERPPESIPPMTDRCPERLSASGISWVPGTDTVWVATDCGLMRSTDAGAHWTQVIVEPMSGGGADIWDHRFHPDRMFAVLAIDAQHVIAGGEGGYYYTNDGRTWRRSADERPNFYCPRGLAVAPGNARLLFRADYDSGRLRYSEDQGITWGDFPGDGLETGNIAPFVRTTTSALGAGWFEIYFGTGVNLKRTTLSTSPAAWRNGGVTWQTASLDHPDPQDLAFHPTTKRPLLLVGDSGALNTEDDGLSWHTVGGGPDGLNALAIYGVAAQRFGVNSLDLSFITWDNWAWSSGDGGLSWNSIPGISEGCNMHGSGTLLGSPADAGIALQSYCRDSQLRGQRGQELSPPDSPPRAESCIRHITFFSSPSDRRPQVLNASYGCEGANVIYDTRPMAGGPWREIMRDSHYPMYGLPQTATNATAAVLFAAYVSTDGRILLARATGIERAGGPSSLTPLAMRNFGSLGVMPWNNVEPVFAVKPDDERVLIAVDKTSETIKRSVNGGDDWQDLDPLTRLVTDDGRLRFYTPDNNTQATVIAFDPDSPDRVVIGTLEAGLLYSTNAGESWRPIFESKKVTHVTAIGFDGHGVAYIGTSGRGLWQWGSDWGVDLSRFPPDMSVWGWIFLNPATGERSHPVAILPVPGPNPLGGVIPVLPVPEPNPFLGVVIARRGYIDDAIMDERGGLTVVVSDTSAIAAYNPNAAYNPEQGAMPTTYSVRQGAMPLTVIASKGEVGFKGCVGCAEAIKQGSRVRAIVYGMGRIRALALGDEAPLPDKLLFAGQSPVVYHPTLELRGGVEAPGLLIAKQGYKITVVGEGFAPSVKGAESAMVRIYLNGQRVADVAPDARGGFSATLELKTRPGPGAVTCTQVTDAGRITRERALMVENLDGQKE